MNVNGLSNQGITAPIDQLIDYLSVLTQWYNYIFLICNLSEVTVDTATVILRLSLYF